MRLFVVGYTEGDAVLAFPAPGQTGCGGSKAGRVNTPGTGNTLCHCTRTPARGGHAPTDKAMATPRCLGDAIEAEPVAERDLGELWSEAVGGVTTVHTVTA